MEYATEQLLELAFAAHRINGSYEKQTHRFSEDKPTVWSNKELVAYSAVFYNKQHEEDRVLKTWIPSDFIPVKVTDEDRTALADAKNYMRRYTLLALGNLSQFQQDVFGAYSSESLPISKLGLIAYFPEFVNRDLKEKLYKTRLKKEFGESQYFEKDIAGVLEVLKVIYVSKEMMEPFYMHFGAVNGNLVCFARKEGLAEGLCYTITAKVKTRERERETNLPMTRINYVKLKKTEM
jgi:hypothetical protein